MEKQNILTRRFHRCDQWKIAAVVGRCEKCGAVCTEAHHIIHSTPENVIEQEVSLSQENLMLLCN